jgi:hypothetical protein
VAGLCRALEDSDGVAGKKRQAHRGDGQRPEHLWRKGSSINRANFAVRAQEEKVMMMVVGDGGACLLVERYFDNEESR